MSDLIDTGSSKKLLVDGRNPFADEVISVSDGAVLSVAAADADGNVLVTALADGTATITVSPGSEDTNRTAGSDDVTASTPVAPTPLAVSLE